MRVERVIFLEHIRRQPTYDVRKFAADIATASQNFAIAAVLGFEAKLLPGGDLDISDEHFSLASVIGIAEHGFPHDTTLLEDSLRRAVERYRPALSGRSLVWVHPGLTFRKAGLDPTIDPAYHSVVRWAQQEQLVLEKNLRYDLVPECILSALDRSVVVLGADAHKMADLERWHKHSRGA